MTRIIFFTSGHIFPDTLFIRVLLSTAKTGKSCLGMCLAMYLFKPVDGIMGVNLGGCKAGVA